MNYVYAPSTVFVLSRKIDDEWRTGLRPFNRILVIVSQLKGVNEKVWAMGPAYGWKEFCLHRDSNKGL